MSKLLINKNETKTLNLYEPIGYSKSKNDSLYILIHRENETVFINLDEKDISNLLYEINNGNIINIDIFIDKNTLEYDTTYKIGKILEYSKIPYRFYDIFINDKNENTLGYDYNFNEYYNVSGGIESPILKKMNLRK